MREVIKNELDVIVFAYGPGCEMCKAIKHVFSSIAQDFAKNHLLRFADIDVSKNTLVGFEVKKYPTIILYPGKDKEKPVEFQDEFSRESFVEFLNAKCSYKIEYNPSVKQDL